MKNTRCLIALIALVGAGMVHAEVSVFSCEPEWKALAEELGGDRVEVFSATTPAQDPHYIQARPSLISRLRRADLLICTGADLEAGWLPLLLRRARNPRVQPGQSGHLMAADHVHLLGVPEKLDRRGGDVHAEGNPHFHLDPRRLLPVAKVLAERLAGIDPEHAAFYRGRLEAFRTSWVAAIRGWEARAVDLRNKSVVVHHREWLYLLDWLGISEAAALEPKPGVPPTSGHLARLMAKLADQQPVAILRAPINDPGPSEWLSARSGVRKVVLPHTVGSTPASKDLYSMFEELVGQLVQLYP